MSFNHSAILDASEAWEPWEPTASDAWDREKAAHLYRRAAFGASAVTLTEAGKRSLSAELDRLLDDSTTYAGAFAADSASLASAARATGDAKAMSVWWLHAMRHSPKPLLEKMTLFWHGHFATGAEKVKEAQLMMDQNELLRKHALGSVSQLVHAISKDPAMLIYLDSAVNRKAHPNENYARELMELFCLGEGNYSEADVQELARCFTGWEVRRKQFRFNAFQHDAGEKKLWERSGIESGEQAIDAVLAHPRAPLFFVAKLYRFFIADEPSPSSELLAPLAKQLVDDQWKIAGVVRRMLASRAMFAASSRARKIRSPIEWTLGWMNALQMTTNLKKVNEGLVELGQALFFPPNVKGWDGGRAWINSSTLVGRTNRISQLLRDESSRFDGGDLNAFFRGQSVRSVDDLVVWCEKQLLAIDLSPSSRRNLTDSMHKAGGFDRLADCLTLVSALPEMHLC